LQPLDASAAAAGTGDFVLLLRRGELLELLVTLFTMIFVERHAFEL
jgi:hypothetical protein